MCFELGITFHACQKLKEILKTKKYISSSTDYIPIRLVVSQTHIKITHFQTFLKNDWVGLNSIGRLGICSLFAEEGECVALSIRINKFDRHAHTWSSFGPLCLFEQSFHILSQHNMFPISKPLPWVNWVNSLYDLIIRNYVLFFVLSIYSAC